MPSTALNASAKRTRTRATVLVVDDEPSMLEIAGDVVGGELGARVIPARSIAEARAVLSKETIDVAILDVSLPDGQGTAFIGELRELAPQAAAIVISGGASVEQSITCFRNGAIDYLPKPFTAGDLAERVSRAIAYQRGVIRTERRLIRLRAAVRKLNSARHTVQKKVDLLCNDLVSAYGELARQVEDVRVREHFRKTISTAVDLEQLLCHTMDWLLASCGYTNIAVFLAGDDGTFELGAYMKYTLPGSKPLTAALRDGIVNQVSEEEFIHWTDGEAQSSLSDAELDHLAGQTIMAVNSTYLGESLAVVVMFRDGKTPFTAEDEAKLRTAAPIFAHALTNLARRDEGHEPYEPLDDDHDADSGWQDEKPRNRKRKKDADSADWWKRGEDPPF